MIEIGMIEIDMIEIDVIETDMIEIDMIEIKSRDRGRRARAGQRSGRCMCGALARGGLFSKTASEYRSGLTQASNIGQSIPKSGAAITWESHSELFLMEIC